MNVYIPEMLPPSVIEPRFINVFMAEDVFNTMMKSVNSAPICPPNPIPPVMIAEGADQADNNNIN